jgi:hypothetical protein
MPHEPSGCCPPLQLIADRRCPACPTVILSGRLPHSAKHACRLLHARWRRSVVIARRHRQRALRQLDRRAEADYRALLAHHVKQEGGGGAA